MFDPKLERQIELEAEMQGRGKDSFRRAVLKAKESGREDSTSYGNQLIAHAIEPVAKGIAAFLEEANNGKPGKKHAAVKYLRQLDPRITAFLSLKCALRYISREAMLQFVAVAIGAKIEDEINYTKFEEENAALFKKMQKHVNKSNHDSYKHRVMTYAMNKYAIKTDGWTNTDRLHVGQKCIDIIIATTGYFEVVSLNVGKRIKTAKGSRSTTVYKLTATKKVLDWIEKKCARSELLFPECLPCIIPPKPWTGPMSGGYHTNHIPQRPLIKTRHASYIEELTNRVDEMSVVYEAVNAMQNTAFRINTKVFEVMDKVWENGGEIGKLPVREDLPLPPCPKCGAPIEEARNHICFEHDKETHNNWKHLARNVHEQNAKMTSQRLQLVKTLTIADKFKDEEEIYFPYQMDFRGRVYAMTMFLNPQGPDYAKGLLTFGKGKPITNQEGAKWLAIHGANTFGHDKCSLEDRFQWVKDNEEDILRVANDPLGFLWWAKEADKPWQFLAFCFEWEAFKREGYGFISTLPVHMDGSCNGLQIFSLMLRDKIGGAATNLIPSADGKPADIYQVVADKVTGKLRELVCTGEIVARVVKDTKGQTKEVPYYDEKDMARKWLELGLDRKATKRQVMVLPYGGTQQSCREYTEEYLKDRIAGGAENPWGEDTFTPSVFLSRLIWDAIGETVIAARDAMAFLQKLARIAASEELPVTWRTPAGMPVLQAYPDQNARRIKTKLGDSIMYLTLNEDSDKIAKHRQASGISPNFVHSLDAAALQLSIHAALKEGVCEFAMVHDSYGVPAQDAAIMAKCLRRVFVEMFRDHDVLGEFRQAISDLVSEDKQKKLPPLPPVGDLDINLVLESDFFFA
jgi:DNA-directed RNA polymerase